VLCSKGYPDKYKNNILIENIEKINLGKNEFVYHAGTKNIENKVYSNGGRVLNFVVLSDSFKFSREKVIKLIKDLNWSNGFYRKDIGFRVVE
jgi:phosphoribosylamine--glycine ligase